MRRAGATQVLRQKRDFLFVFEYKAWFRSLEQGIDGGTVRLYLVVIKERKRKNCSDTTVAGNMRSRWRSKMKGGERRACGVYELLGALVE